jgi:ribosomal protein L10
MSKYVKQLVSDHVKKQLDGVSDLLVVNVIGLTAQRATALRKTLRESNMQLLVVKNSVARRATEGTVLAPAFEGATGTMAIVWGGEDIVSLAKTITKIAGEKAYEKFTARGGVMGGTALSPADVFAVSKWPNRAEQLSILSGQILSPGAMLAGQLIGPGGKLGSQIEQKGKEGEGQERSAAPAATT